MRYIDIITLAIDIHSKMDIDSAVPTKIEVYDTTNSSTPTLEKAILSYVTHTRVEIHSASVPSDELDGFYRKYITTEGLTEIKIDIREALNSCWTRFVATKEFSHIIMDKEEISYTKNISDLLNVLLAGNTSIKEIDDTIDSEYLAIYFAIELLLPYCYNDFIINTSTRSRDIATLFMVPEAMVDFVRSSGYQKLRKEAYTD